MKALVTGASGFVGSHLVRRLLQEGAQVSVLLRHESPASRLQEILSGITVIRGDLGSLHQVSDSVKAFAPDAVFHLGWQGASSYRFQDDPEQVFSNLQGSLELVRLAAECGCKTWIGMGSVLEYGCYPVPVSETLPPSPRTLYGATKYSTGLLAQKLCAGYGMRFTWFRLFWAYGPGDDKARMIPYLISRLLKKERPALTPGEQRWDYLYMDDVVESLWKAAVKTEVEGFFNLGSGMAYPLHEVAERIRDLIDPSLPLGLGDIPYRPDQIMHLQADMTRLRSAAGWKPSVSLDEGLKRTVEWFRGREVV